MSLQKSSFILSARERNACTNTCFQAAAIDIVANDAIIKPDGSEWKPIWRHDTELGHDKALSVNEARAKAQSECLPDEMPLIIFIGDGVSDLAAAREADVLFARRGLRLEEYCLEHGIAYTPFDSFLDIKREIEAISAEDSSKTGGVGRPVRYNPRANMWRRISSKEAVCYSHHARVNWKKGACLANWVLFFFVLGAHFDGGCYALQGREDVPLARDVFRLQAPGDDPGT
jgi:hypothetical protein